MKIAKDIQTKIVTKSLFMKKQQLEWGKRMQEKIQTIQKNVEELLVVGNLDNALKTVEEMLAAKDLTKREQQTGLVLLAHIQNYFGYHKKALATIKKLFEEKIKEKIILINAEIEQLTAKHHLGKITYYKK